jgi:hypothetical protein
MSEVLAPLPDRFEGMPGMMQGGYIAALAAGNDERAMRVRIRRPLHPGDVLSRSTEGDDLLLTRANELVLKGSPSDLHVTDPGIADVNDVRRAAQTPLPFDIPFPSCVGCGNGHNTLGASIRPLTGTGRMISLWTPAPEDADDSGDTPRAHVWTVTDCITSWSVFVDPPEHVRSAVTGNIAMQFFAELRGGETYVLQSWRERDDERSVICGGAIHHLGGTLIALADQELIGTDGWGMDIPVTALA